MRRFLFILTLFCPTLAPAEQSLRQFHAEVSAPSSVIVAELKSQMPDTVMFASDDIEGMLSYSGLNTPPALVSFLNATFPDLDTAALTPGKTAIIGITISQGQSGGSVTALINADFATSETNLDLPADATVLLDTEQPGNCAGQKVLSQPGPMDTASQTYQDMLKTSGFTLQNDDPEEVSFFIGRSDSCNVMLYLQPDPDTQNATLVVLRFLED